MHRAKLIVSTFLLSVLASTFVLGQEAENTEISLQEAITIALQNNHDIVIARNTEEISQNNATAGNAGLLPSVTASGSYSGTNTDTELRLFGGTTQTINGAGSTTLSGSIAANYLLFDGFGNYYRFRSLKNLEEQAGVQTRLQVEGTLLQVINFYLQVVAQKKSADIAQEAIERSLDRFSRVNKRFELGNATRLDVLSAQVDLNADSVSYIQAVTNLENAKRDLLVQLGSEPDMDITIMDDIEIDRSLGLDGLLDDATSSNASLVLSRLNNQNALLGLKQNRSGRFPKVNLNASYDYFENNADAGQFEFLKTVGFSGGISVSLNLFNGFQQETAIQNAQVAIKNSEEALFQTQKTLKRDVLNTYSAFETNLFLLDKESLNLETAELNFERSENLFELGQITNTQFREAQLNVSRVQLNMVGLLIQAKLSEVSLYQLSGELISFGE